MKTEEDAEDTESLMNSSSAVLVSLHDQFVGSADDGMLHLLQFVFHSIEAEDALLKILG